MYYKCVDVCVGYVEYDSYCDFTSCSLVRDSNGVSLQLFSYTVVIGGSNQVKCTPTCQD